MRSTPLVPATENRVVCCEATQFVVAVLIADRRMRGVVKNTDYSFSDDEELYIVVW